MTDQVPEPDSLEQPKCGQVKRGDGLIGVTVHHEDDLARARSLDGHLERAAEGSSDAQ